MVHLYTRALHFIHAHVQMYITLDTTCTIHALYVFDGILLYQSSMSTNCFEKRLADEQYSFWDALIRQS